MDSTPLLNHFVQVLIILFRLVNIHYIVLLVLKYILYGHLKINLTIIRFIEDWEFKGIRYILHLVPEVVIVGSRNALINNINIYSNCLRLGSQWLKFTQVNICRMFPYMAKERSQISQNVKVVLSLVAYMRVSIWVAISVEVKPSRVIEFLSCYLMGLKSSQKFSSMTIIRKMRRDVSRLEFYQ